MAKQHIWEFQKPNTIVYAEDTDNIKKRFSFQLVRYKDNDTYEESLKIISLLNGKDNGSIVTDIMSLDKDIKQLMKYGVVLSALDFRDLRIAIENSYLDIPETEVKLSDDTRLTDLLAAVKTFVEGDRTLITQKYCFIQVIHFNELAEDCGYDSYEMKNLRNMLHTKQYIRKQGDRYAVLERIANKPQRVIAFDREKLGVEVPPVKQTHAGKGDIDG